MIINNSPATRPPAPSSPAPAPDQVSLSDRNWKDEVLYFAMTDRFENGNKDNDQGCDPSKGQRFHGGDWKGITNKLDDLKDMGVTALWISPVQEQDRDFLGMDGYHGYWPRDFKKPEPAFGSMDELKELVQKAHEKGIKVVIDMVLNHTGYNHPWTTDPTKKDYFHDRKLTFWKDMEKGSLFGLPDLAQENPEVADQLIDMGKYWANQTGCDGFRLDALMHFPAAFQQRFVAEMKKERGDSFFVLGEAYTGPAKRVAEFQNKGHMDSVYDFPLSEALRNVAGRNEKLNILTRYLKFRRLVKEFPGEAYRIKHDRPDAWQLHEIFAQDSAYQDPQMLTTLVENHDMPRFLSAAGPDAREKFEQALTFQFGARGIPLLYYGAEDGMGLKEGDLRADKRSGADPAMREFVKHLCQIRHDSVALRRGEQKELYVDPRTYAFARVHPDQTMVVVANFDRQDVHKSIPMPAENLKLLDKLTGKIYQLHGPNLDVELPAHGTLLLEVVGKSSGPPPPTPAPEHHWLGVDWGNLFHKL